MTGSRQSRYFNSLFLITFSRVPAICKRTLRSSVHIGGTRYCSRT